MDTRLSLALKYYESRLNDDAWEALRSLAEESDAPREVLQLAAVLRLDAGAFENAIAFADRLIALDGTAVDGWLAKGKALLALDQIEGAGETFAKACELAPDNAEIHFNTGLWHEQTGKLREAERFYRKTLELDRNLVQAWNNLGNVLDGLGRPDEAAAAFRRAIALRPDFSEAHNNLGASLAGQGRFMAAADSYERAANADPDNLSARVNFGAANLEIGAWGEAVAVFDGVLAVDHGNRAAGHNRLYADLYISDDPAAVRASHAAWGGVWPAAPAIHPADPRGARPLRIGYVSPDFRRHSVSFFTEPLLASHDAAEAEVFCYSDAVLSDEVTERFKCYAPHWRDVHNMTDDALADLVRADRIDILVDLAGHTTGNRLPVFARRCAPIQVSALGYPATTGLANMDYRLCDALTDPAPEADGWSVERLVRLESGLHCFRPPQGAPEPGPLPALENGRVTYGSFNKLAKISPETVDLWAGVLRAQPSARLVLKAKALTEAAVQARVRALFAARGVDAPRLDLMGWVSGDVDHLRLYDGIDIALDTFPYNGTTTTCEALWMGVPVVSLAGRGHAARVGVSLLTRLGRAAWVARTPDEYVECAGGLAADMDALSAERGALRARVRNSPLCDEHGYAKAVETAYRAMWRTLTGG